MAYRPLLGMGKGYEMMHWEVGLTMVITTLGLVAFAAAIEKALADVADGITAVNLAPLLRGKSVNTPAFLLAVSWLDLS